MYNVKLPKFEGPLDLLLNLIEERRLDITRISIATVADDYLEYIRASQNISLEHLAEFVNIASKIILIKSQNIIPSLEISPEEEKEIKDLEEQLRLYKLFKSAAESLRSRESKKMSSFSRDYLAGITVSFSPPKNFNTFDLRKFFTKVLSEIVILEKIPEESVREIITLEEKINHFQKTLQKRVEITFSQMYNSSADKIEIIVSFLAMLEMIKQRIISVDQEKLFEDIKIKKHE